MKFILLFTLSTFSAAEFKRCPDDPDRLKLRSIELSEIVRADQKDREDFWQLSPQQMNQVGARDEARRKRVGEIFGEGCFSSAADYASAALVFQHGVVPEHFLQAFIWAKGAVDRGDHRQKRLMALAIDRYLVNIGHRQLFGSQAHRAGMQSTDCWCLQPIESSYPDSSRKDYMGQGLNEAFAWLGRLNKGLNCPVAECSTDSKPTPQGTVPGFW